jgi:Tol biopolymer transport system component
VVTVGADGKNPSKVLSNNPNQPVFLSWSPDGNQISVLLSGANQLELDLVEASAGASAAPRKVAEGNAIYTGWSPDSQQLLIHATGSTASSSTLALLAAKDAKAQAVPVKVSPSSFRSPAFSGDGTRLAFAVLNAQTGSDEIFVHDKSGTSIGSIEVGGTGASFNWSPAGNKLAHTYQLSNSQGLFYKGIALSELDVNPPTNGKLTATQIVNEPVAGFFWSPNGKKLAYITLNSDQSLLVWKVYDLDTKKSTTLTEWLPSQTWLQLIRYFDQYAQTNSIWAPDSKTLVFSGFSKDEAAALSTNQSSDDPIPTVYLMPVEGADTGKLIPVAPGNLAFWAK